MWNCNPTTNPQDKINNALDSTCAPEDTLPLIQVASKGESRAF